MAENPHETTENPLLTQLRGLDPIEPFFVSEFRKLVEQLIDEDLELITNSIKENIPTINDTVFKNKQALYKIISEQQSKFYTFENIILRLAFNIIKLVLFIPSVILTALQSFINLFLSIENQINYFRVIEFANFDTLREKMDTSYRAAIDKKIEELIKTEIITQNKQTDFFNSPVNQNAFSLEEFKNQGVGYIESSKTKFGIRTINKEPFKTLHAIVSSNMNLLTQIQNLIKTTINLKDTRLTENLTTLYTKILSQKDLSSFLSNLSASDLQIIYDNRNNDFFRAILSIIKENSSLLQGSPIDTFLFRIALNPDYLDEPIKYPREINKELLTNYFFKAKTANLDERVEMVQAILTQCPRNPVNYKQTIQKLYSMYPDDNYEVKLEKFILMEMSTNIEKIPTSITIKNFADFAKLATKEPENRAAFINQLIAALAPQPNLESIQSIISTFYNSILCLFESSKEQYKKLSKEKLGYIEVLKIIQKLPPESQSAYLTQVFTGQFNCEQFLNDYLKTGDIVKLKKLLSSIAPSRPDHLHNKEYWQHVLGSQKIINEMNPLLINLQQFLSTHGADQIKITTKAAQDAILAIARGEKPNLIPPASSVGYLWDGPEVPELRKISTVYTTYINTSTPRPN